MLFLWERYYFPSPQHSHNPCVYLLRKWLQHIIARPNEDHTMRNLILAFATLTALAPAALIAQTTTTPAPRPTINQRKQAQRDRIAAGVKSGQLTAGETSRLEHQEAGINREERGMRAQDNGHLTKQDRRTLTAQQNQESRRIRRDKHNARVQ